MVYRNIGVCSYSVLTSFFDRSPFTLPSRCDAAHYEPDAIILYWLSHSWKFFRVIFLAYIQHAMTLQFSLYEFIKIPCNFRLFRYIHERILEKGIYPLSRKKNIYKQIKTKKKKPNSNKNLKTKTDKCIERDGLKLIIKW